MDKWGSNYLIEKKTLWEKKKLLVMSNFFFSHYVFKSCLLWMRQNEYLWSKWLKCNCVCTNIDMRIDILFRTFKQYEDKGHSAVRQKAMFTLINSYNVDRELKEEELDKVNVLDMSQVLQKAA